MRHLQQKQATHHVPISPLRVLYTGILLVIGITPISGQVRYSANYCTTIADYTVPVICTAPGEIPLGTFPVPAVGGAYTDPNFGGTVKVLTQNAVHAYATPSAFSATGKYILVLSADGTPNVVEAASSRYLYRNQPQGDIRWDSLNDDILYIVTGTKVYKRALSTQSSTLLVDYSADPYRFTGINMGGTGDTSKDNWIAFWVEREHKVCALDLRSVRTYCADYTAAAPGNRVGWNFIDYALVTKGRDTRTGKRYVLLMANPAFGVYSVNEAAGRLDFELRSPELPRGLMGAWGNGDDVCDVGEGCMTTPHADVFEDYDGQQYLVSLVGVETPCQAVFSTIQISKGQSMLKPVALGGGRKDVLVAFKCGLTWSSYHVGCAKRSPYCVISMDSPAAGLPTVMRKGTEPYFGEVMIMRGNGTEFRRLTMHRSVLWSYWDQPRACISSDGRYVLYDTNFGRTNTRWVVLGYTGFLSTQAQPGRGRFQ